MYLLPFSDTTPYLPVRSHFRALHLSKHHLSTRDSLWSEFPGLTPWVWEKWHFSEEILKLSFLQESFNFGSLNVVSTSPINKKSVLVQIIYWGRPGELLVPFPYTCVCVFIQVTIKLIPFETRSTQRAQTSATHSLKSVKQSTQAWNSVAYCFLCPYPENFMNVHPSGITWCCQQTRTQKVEKGTLCPRG